MNNAVIRKPGNGRARAARVLPIGRRSCFTWLMNLARLRKSGSGPGYLDGQMLVAMPGMSDRRFSRSVIFLFAHSAEGAMGIIVNHRAQNMTFRDLLVQLDVLEADQAIRLPPRVTRAHVLRGGPVETSRGFVLHTPDFFIDDSTLLIDDEICLTATLDILKAIAQGSGPENSVLALGHAGWAPGQLENEIRGNGWLNCPADPGLIFDADLDSKYDRAMRKIGVDPAMLSAVSGRA